MRAGGRGQKRQLVGSAPKTLMRAGDGFVNPNGLVLLLSCDRGISSDAGIFWAFSLVNVPGAPLVECFAARFPGETNADPMWSCALALFIEYFPELIKPEYVQSFQRQPSVPTFSA